MEASPWGPQARVQQTRCRRQQQHTPPHFNERPPVGILLTLSDLTNLNHPQLLLFLVDELSGVRSPCCSNHTRTPPVFLSFIAPLPPVRSRRPASHAPATPRPIFSNSHRLPSLRDGALSQQRRERHDQGGAERRPRQDRKARQEAEGACRNEAPLGGREGGTPRSHNDNVGRSPGPPILRHAPGGRACDAQVPPTTTTTLPARPWSPAGPTRKDTRLTTHAHISDLPPGSTLLPSVTNNAPHPKPPPRLYPPSLRYQPPSVTNNAPHPSSRWRR